MTAATKRMIPGLVLTVATAACTASVSMPDRSTISPSVPPTLPTNTAAPSEPENDERVIATAVEAAFDFQLVVEKASEGPPPTATVTLKVYEGGSIIDQALVDQPGSFFWFPLTGPEAICSFVTRADARDIVIDVQLLLSPSLGCSDPIGFVLNGDTLQPIE